MPYVHVSTNIKRSSVDTDLVLQTLNKMLSDTLEIPQIYVMAHVDFDQDIQLANTKQGKIDAERNPKTVAFITGVVTAVFGIQPTHVFINLNDVPGDNWGYDGKVLPN